MPWSAEFDDPIELQDGHRLRTGKCNCIMVLPDDKHRQVAWQCAMEALILIADSGGPTMLARIGVTSALNRNRRDTARI